MPEDKVYLHAFRVNGRGQFPLDMLRYDRCFPSGGDDAANLHASVREHRTIQLIAANSQRFWEPTAGRWASFFWHAEKE